MQEISLMDISDKLFILDQNTIETLVSLDEACECIALYIIYYRCAKWQKTNQAKATDTYVMKTLKWGEAKLRKIKNILLENGLIEKVQTRKNGKITGWYIKVNYIVNKKSKEDIKLTINNQNIQKQDVAETSSSYQETIALKNNIKCLKKEIEMLKEENNKLRLLKEINSKSDLEKTETYKEIINYMNTVNEHKRFNKKIPFSYSYKSKGTQELINARLREGYDIERFKDVIWWGYRKFVEFDFESLNGESSVKYFRPSTLFSAKHFEEYLNEYNAYTTPVE